MNLVVYDALSCPRCKHQVSKGKLVISRTGRIICKHCNFVYKNYNVVCKHCRKAFNPIKVVNERNKLCTECLPLYRYKYKKIVEIIEYES